MTSSSTLRSALKEDDGTNIDGTNIDDMNRVFRLWVVAKHSAMCRYHRQHSAVGKVYTVRERT